MVNQKPVLEILIPTFKRSHSAQEAIESVLACNDMRLTVRCNSNGFEPVLEKYRNLDDRVNYDSFESIEDSKKTFINYLQIQMQNFA